MKGCCPTNLSNTKVILPSISTKTRCCLNLLNTKVILSKVIKHKEDINWAYQTAKMPSNSCKQKGDDCPNLVKHKADIATIHETQSEYCLTMVSTGCCHNIMKHKNGRPQIYPLNSVTLSEIC